MKKIIKFSKPYTKSLLKIKKDFYNNNISNLKSILQINRVYTQQPKRLSCENCKKTLKKIDFNSFGVNYTICNKCSHLNGEHLITKNFARKLYSGKKSKLYSINYLKDYKSRVKNIYTPKLDFLTKVINKKISILDIGSGAGHFLKSCENKKIKATGYETSKHLIKLAKKVLKKNKIYHVEIEDVKKIIKQTNLDCISMIGVLEHLSNPNSFIDYFKKSKAKYLYISVPLLSFSTFLEHANQKIFPRQLSGGHTHLYSKESLYHLFKVKKLKIMGEWWFGTDIADLYRTITNNFDKKNSTRFYKMFDKYFLSQINEIQNIIDKKKMCSEVHMILSK